MDALRTYIEDQFYQLKALLFPSFELHSHFIPDIIIHSRQREREWKIEFPNFGNGNRNGK